MPAHAYHSEAAGAHTSLPLPSPPKILRREPISPTAVSQVPSVQQQAPLPQPQHGGQGAPRPQYPPQHQQQHQQRPPLMEPLVPRSHLHAAASQHSPPEQSRLQGQGPLQFGQLESPSGQAKQILGQHLQQQGSFQQHQQQQLIPNGQHPLHNHPIQQQRPHSGQGFSPKVQQQLGFSPSPAPAEPAKQGPLMTFGQPGQGPPGKAGQMQPGEPQQDAAQRELEAQQGFMRQKALQRHQEAMARQQQQERVRRDSESSRRSLPQSTHSHGSHHQESDRDAGVNGGYDARASGGRGRGRGRGAAQHQQMGLEGRPGAPAPPQTAALAPSEHLIMQVQTLVYAQCSLSHFGDCTLVDKKDDS